MTEDLVLADQRGGVATLTLNRPAKLNALTPAMFERLRHHLDAIAGDEAVGCVVLAGAGRSFCAGHDLAAVSGGERAPSTHFAPETVDALEQLPQPTVARIQGHCLTGGLELALACDLLVASESAQLGDTHGQWGLVPIWGMSVRLPERVGPSRAKELMFTSRKLSGAEAATSGLVDVCVADDELDHHIETLTERIVANSWGTNRRVKQLLADSARLPRREALVHERQSPYGMAEDRADRLARRPGREG